MISKIFHLDIDHSKKLFTNKALFLLLVPLMIEQLLNSLMGTVDTMMVSTISSAAISAVSLVDSINILVMQVFTALATGGTIVCAQYLGGKEKQKSVKAAEQVLLSMVVISTVLMAVCLIFCSPLLHLIFGQVEPDVMEAARIYFFITAISYPFIGVFNANAAFFRSEGNSTTPMVVSVICNVINVGGNALLIYVFHMGVTGAAIATLVSRVIMAVVMMILQRRPKQVIVIREYGHIRPDLALIGVILSLGIPNGIENGMFQFGKLAIQSTVSTLGTTAIAAQAMAIVLENMNGISAIGIGIGLMTVVGQCIGAGQKEQAKYYIIKLTLIGEVVVLTGCLLILALTKPITVIAGMEPASADMCLFMMRWITLVKPIVWTWAFVPVYGLRAAGDVKFSMLISTMTMWVFRVALCIYLCRAHGFGPIAVWIGMFTDWTVRAIIFSGRFWSGRWLKHSAVTQTD